MAKDTRGEMVEVDSGEIKVEEFDYAKLEPGVEKKARAAAENIRQSVKKTLENLIAVGKELQSVKDSLEHGYFGSWLRKEFGWSQKTAENYMNVAKELGPKIEMITNLKIQPTAAYLLAAPSTPEKALETAIKRAEGGEKITPKVVRTILAESKPKKPGKKKAIPTNQLAKRLTNVLEAYRKRWSSKEIDELAKQLRAFADDLERSKRGDKNKAKD